MSSVVKRINEYNKGLPADLRKLKWDALKESPFRFYRGTCHLFVEDFNELYGFNSKIKTWVCGDAHFENFGSYKGANRLVYFDLNDFDEAILANPEPELCRFLTSIIIAGNQMKANDTLIYKTIQEIVDQYAMTLYKEKALMMEGELAKGILKKYFQRLLSRDREKSIAKHTTTVKGKLMLKPDGEHFIPIDEKKKNEIFTSLKPLMKKNKHFVNLHFLDTAFRIAGTGSLGLERFCVLCYDKHRMKHYLIDIKQTRRSCYKEVLKLKQPKFKNEAERIIHAEYIMQFNSAAFLTSLKIANRWYVVKEMQPLIDKLAIESFGNDFAALKEAASNMAPLIAYSQLRSSGHLGSSTIDELKRFSEKEKWKKDIIDVSSELASRNNKYYSIYCKDSI